MNEYQRSSIKYGDNERENHSDKEDGKKALFELNKKISRNVIIYPNNYL